MVGLELAFRHATPSFAETTGDRLRRRSPGAAGSCAAGFADMGLNATINFNGLGAKSIVFQDGTVVRQGDYAAAAVLR
jgi:hypothetical protein